MSSFEAALPTFAVPPFLDKPPTSLVHLDAFPIISMVSCFPTLAIFWHRGRYADLVRRVA